MKTHTIFKRLLLMSFFAAVASFGINAESVDVVDPETGLNFIVNTSGRSVTSVLFSGGKLAEDGALPIPAYITYNGEKVEVTGISEELNQLNPDYAEKLTSLTTPPGVTSLPDSIFKGYVNLTKVDLPDVTSLGSSAFKNCTSLSNVILSPQLALIPYQSFYGCKSLTMIDLPEDLDFVGRQSFEGTSLTDVSIPAKVSEVDFDAFRNCPLQSLTILGDSSSPVPMLLDHFCFSTQSLSRIYCYRPVPPIMTGTGTAFSTKTFGTAVLQLLGDAQDHLNDYLNDAYWKRFANGRDIMTDVDAIEYDTETPVTVYTIDGVMLLRDADSAQFEALPSGIYIVSGHKVMK